MRLVSLTRLPSVLLPSKPSDGALCPGSARRSALNAKSGGKRTAARGSHTITYRPFTAALRQTPQRGGVCSEDYCGCFFCGVEPALYELSRKIKRDALSFLTLCVRRKSAQMTHNMTHLVRLWSRDQRLLHANATRLPRPKDTSMEISRRCG